MNESDRIIELMRIERECVSRDCDRECGKCDLVQDRSELIAAYDIVIKTMTILRDFYSR